SLGLAAAAFTATFTAAFASAFTTLAALAALAALAPFTAAFFAGVAVAAEASKGVACARIGRFDLSEERRVGVEQIAVPRGSRRVVRRLARELGRDLRREKPLVLQLIERLHRERDVERTFDGVGVGRRLGLIEREEVGRDLGEVGVAEDP